MNKLQTLLDDRITVNAINGKAEAVSALQELREAIAGPMMDMEKQVVDAASHIQSMTSSQLYLNQRALELLLKIFEGCRK